VKKVEFLPIKTEIEMPNGLQWHDKKLYVIDQKTDNIFILNEKGKKLDEFSTLCENGSGITIGDNFIWLASNGETEARPFRGSDTHISWILKLDMNSRNLISRFPTPDGGGVHGLEWDNGLLWITAFNPTALILVNPNNFEVQFKFEIDQSPHGLAIEGEGIWCSDRVDRNIIKYNKSNGKILEKIEIPDDGPDPHGLSIKDKILWYSDAAFPNPMRPFPEIGSIELR
tara:strand:- start:423 stop:1106 length:684 start_codon:yes stop_codon:yes gene_type:complete